MADKWDERKKAQEDEYFVRKERELLEKMKAKQQAEAQQASQAAAQLKCPRCGTVLKESTFQKIVVDQCPDCNGVWLDAGEVEQLVANESGGWLGKFWQKSS
ncbi:MAG TPA: zf-TFIIB domain-containing protein [Verrucomicrobiae bacterium]|jgi:uncharacterized protein|nr:zf-TFIIB domain-containing protein [Verrucomicrobiae bacterium]